MLSITLRQIGYACAIARHGGLTTAAQALHVSQPALSVALAQLETHLGHPLFLRRPGGPMIPTAYGRVWLHDAQRQLDAIAHLMQGTNRPTPLRLAMFEDLAPLILAPLMAASPDLTPQVIGFDALTAALTIGSADLAVTWDLGLPPHLHRRELVRLPPQAVLPLTHPLARHPSLTLQDIAAEPLILTNQGQSIDHIRALFARQGLAPQIAHRCQTLDLMRSFAANGLGVGLSYSQPAPRHSADGAALTVIPLRNAGTEPVVLVTPTAPTGLTNLCHVLANLLQLFAPVTPSSASQTRV